jgi:hypothetical protein
MNDFKRKVTIILTYEGVNRDGLELPCSRPDHLENLADSLTRLMQQPPTYDLYGCKGRLVESSVLGALRAFCLNAESPSVDDLRVEDGLSPELSENGTRFTIRLKLKPVRNCVVKFPGT